MKHLTLCLLGLISCGLTPESRLAKELSLPVGSFEEQLSDPIELSQLPTDEPFSILAIDPLNWLQIPTLDLVVQEDGTPQLTRTKKTALQPLLRGQKIYIAALSDNRKILVPFVLDPLQTSIDEAEFSLLTTHRKGTHFVLEGKNLIPGEKLIVAERSGKQFCKHTAVADSQGQIHVQIEPIVLGRLGGTADLTIQRGLAEAHIDFTWGSFLERDSRSLIAGLPGILKNIVSNNP